MNEENFLKELNKLDRESLRDIVTAFWIKSLLGVYIARPETFYTLVKAASTKNLEIKP